MRIFHTSILYYGTNKHLLPICSTKAFVSHVITLFSPQYKSTNNPHYHFLSYSSTTISNNLIFFIRSFLVSHFSNNVGANNLLMFHDLDLTMTFKSHNNDFLLFFIRSSFQKLSLLSKTNNCFL